MNTFNIDIQIKNILQTVYKYILALVYTMNPVVTKPKTKTMKKMSRERLLLCRNASSPYTEYETKVIRRTNFIITDDKRKSRLGKSVSFSRSPDIKLVEDINFCSFINKWVPL